MTIDWIRHTSLSIDPILCYGQTDVPVSKNFEREAEQVKQKLDALGHRYDASFTSPLSRATLLADYCGYGDAIRDDRLMEFNFGSWEMRPWYDISDLALGNEDLWFATWHQLEIPDGETLQNMILRVEEFISSCKEKGYSHIICFCHGGVINTAQYITGQIGYDDIFKLTPKHGEIISISH